MDTLDRLNGNRRANLPKIDKITLLILAEHKRALQELARREYEPMSVILRKMIRAELEHQGLLEVENFEILEGAKNDGEKRIGT